MALFACGKVPMTDLERCRLTTKRSLRRDRTDQGFTLTELMIVLVILGLLTAIIAPNMMGRLGVARSQSARVQIENLAGALETFKIDTGRYPTTEMGLAALETPPTGVSNWTGPYLRRGGVPLDPWGNAYIYASDRADEFTLESLGRDGEVGGQGEDADLRTTAIDSLSDTS